jgi:hypothetical protein
MPSFCIKSYFFAKDEKNSKNVLVSDKAIFLNSERHQFKFWFSGHQFIFLWSFANLEI